MDCPKRLNKHEILIATEDHRKIFDQLVLWGEASWWPQQCMMQFRKVGSDPIQKGTIYHQRVKVPFGPRWVSVISDIVDNKSISRGYFDSFIEGEEQTRLVSTNGMVKVEYELTYTIKGFFYRWAWDSCLCALHDSNIQNVLQHLKKHIEQ